jgi:hypothetical protein
MSNAVAAYYAYLAQVDREKARVFRNFGYFASADYVERRAERYDRESRAAARESKAAPQLPTGPLGLPTSHDSETSDLHTTSDGYQQTGLFAEQEPTE